MATKHGKCDVRGEDPSDQRVFDFCNEGAKKERLAFPNFFITIAPAEWTFPLPGWLQDLVKAGKLSECSGVVALHIYHVLITTMKEVLQPGDWFSDVFHYCMRIEFQGRGTVHIHVAMWAIARPGLDLEGRTAEYGAPAFVMFLSNLFGGANVDVQLGSG